MTTQLEVVAKEVATVDEAVMKVLPFISTFIGFVPGAAVAIPFLPLVGELLAALDSAAQAVSTGNNAGGIEAIIDEIKNHLTPGAPNSPILSAPVTNS
jgi:hypothetical protein